jgi:hypothetical protein
MKEPDLLTPEGFSNIGRITPNMNLNPQRVSNLLRVGFELVLKNERRRFTNTRRV